MFVQAASRFAEQVEILPCTAVSKAIAIAKRFHNAKGGHTENFLKMQVIQRIHNRCSGSFSEVILLSVVDSQIAAGLAYLAAKLVAEDEVRELRNTIITL